MVNFGSEDNPSSVQYYVVGIGHVTLHRDLTLEGQQTSSTTPLADTHDGAAAILACSYNLTGSYTINSDRTGTAKIKFDPTGSSKGKCATEIATFSLVIVDTDHIWMISTGATSPNGPKPDEVVQIEAIKMK
jgi:hypothetical protein